jgi:DNA-binding transcriptional LysR family regulator
MSAFMQRFTAEHPRAKVQLEYLHPHRVYEEVEKGDADLGLVSYPKQSETIAALPWRKEPMVVVTPPDHPLTRQMTAAGVGPSSARAALADLNGLPFVAFEEGLAIRGEIDRALARQGVHVHLELEFDNVETIKRAVEAGAGVSILPRPCIDRELALGSLAVVGIADEAVCRALGIIHRRDRQLSELARHFIGLLQADADFSDRPSGTSLEASAAPTN